MLHIVKHIIHTHIPVGWSFNFLVGSQLKGIQYTNNFTRGGKITIIILQTKSSIQCQWAVKSNNNSLYKSIDAIEKFKVEGQKLIIAIL